MTNEDDVAFGLGLMVTSCLFLLGERMLEAACDNVRSILEIDELAGTLEISVSFLFGRCFLCSPEFELVSTSSNKVDVIEVLVFIDSEMASADAAHPARSSFAGN